MHVPCGEMRPRTAPFVFLLDIDVLIRLQRVLKLRHESVSDVIHLTQGDSKRSLAPGWTRDASAARNMRLATVNYARGELQGTLERDIGACAGRIVAEPV
jgi:hypothetical protein